MSFFYFLSEDRDAHRGGVRNHYCFCVARGIEMHAFRVIFEIFSKMFCCWSECPYICISVVKGVVMSEKKKNKKLIFLGALAIVVAGFSLIIAFNWAWDKSSLNDSCMSCHYHTDADITLNVAGKSVVVKALDAQMIEL